MKINHILNAIGTSNITDDQSINAIEVDSRKLDKNTWWLATQGIAHHALDFYSNDLECAGILYESPYRYPPKRAIPIKHLSSKVSKIADVFYGHPSRKMTMIAVTGTDGKSSLAHFIAQALDAAMIGTIGIGKLEKLQTASHTTPDALSTQRILYELEKSGVKTAAMEVSSHALDQDRVAEVNFDIAVFSNLSRDHLDYHKTIDAYFEAKAKLFSMDIKHAIINIDDQFGRRLITDSKINPSAQIWLVSAKNAQDFSISNARYVSAQSYALNNDGIDIDVLIDGEKLHIHAPLLARFNVDNILNVIACLAALNYSLDDIQLKVNALKGVPGRVEVIDLPQGKAIIDYAHTVGAMESVLQGIRPHVKGKLWVLFGCGGNRDAGKRPLMGAAAESFADEVIITDDNPRLENPNEIIDDIMQGISKLEKVHVIQPREKAILYGLEQLKDEDVLLIAGKGHENYQIIGDVKHHFSDQEEVKKWQMR